MADLNLSGSFELRIVYVIGSKNHKLVRLNGTKERNQVKYEKMYILWKDRRRI